MIRTGQSHVIFRLSLVPLGALLFIFGSLSLYAQELYDLSLDTKNIKKQEIVKNVDFTFSKTHKQWDTRKKQRLVLDQKNKITTNNKVNLVDNIRKIRRNPVSLDLTRRYKNIESTGTKKITINFKNRTRQKEFPIHFPFDLSGKTFAIKGKGDTLEVKPAKKALRKEIEFVKKGRFIPLGTGWLPEEKKAEGDTWKFDVEELSEKWRLPTPVSNPANKDFISGEIKSQKIISGNAEVKLKDIFSENNEILAEMSVKTHGQRKLVLQEQVAGMIFEKAKMKLKKTYRISGKASGTYLFNLSKGWFESCRGEGHYSFTMHPEVLQISDPKDELDENLEERISSSYSEVEGTTSTAIRIEYDVKMSDRYK